MNQAYVPTYIHTYIRVILNVRLVYLHMDVIGWFSGAKLQLCLHVQYDLFKYRLSSFPADTGTSVHTCVHTHVVHWGYLMYIS